MLYHSARLTDERKKKTNKWCATCTALLFGKLCVIAKATVVNSLDLINTAISLFRTWRSASVRVVVHIVAITFFVPSQYTEYYHTLINLDDEDNFCEFLPRCTWKPNVDSIIVCWSHSPGL